VTVEILSALTPIVESQEEPLREQLEHFRHQKSPFAAVPGTHAARWVVMNWLGTGDRRRRRRLRPAQLLFSAVVDGPVEAWLWGLLEKQGQAVDDVWRHCTDWPTGGDRTAQASWLIDHRLDITFPFIAHDTTVFDIKRGLALRSALAKLIPEAETMTANELREAYAGLPRR
jgi:hypothetical protein